MFKVSGVNIDPKNNIITRYTTYNAGDRIVKIEELQTKDLGDFVRVTEWKQGKKIKSELKPIDRDTYVKRIR